jgi:hypothetical protein
MTSRAVIGSLMVVLVGAGHLCADLDVPLASTESGFQLAHNRIITGGSPAHSVKDVDLTDYADRTTYGKIVLRELSFAQSSMHDEPVGGQRLAGPGGASLVLFGLGTLAVVGVGRAARRSPFSAVAGWFHDGGPWQIGHTVAVHPDLDFGKLPLCSLVQTVRERPCGRLLMWQWEIHPGSPVPAGTPPARAPPIC